MKAKLVVVGGDVKTKEVRLNLPTVVGRGRNVTLTLPHALVSRRHCEIYEKSGRLVVRDLGSLNGTFVNNEQITSEHILENGQLLTIGAVTFRAVYQEMDKSSDSNSSDVLAAKDTVGSVESDTGRIELPDLDRIKELPQPVADQKTVPAPTKPRSNPRPFQEDSTPTPIANVFENTQTVQDIHHRSEDPGGMMALNENGNPASAISLSDLSGLPNQKGANASFVDKVVLEETGDDAGAIDSALHKLIDKKRDS